MIKMIIKRNDNDKNDNKFKLQKSNKINSIAKNLEMILNKHNKKKEENDKVEIIQETIIYQKIEENNENNNIKINKNKKKKAFKQFEDN